MKLHALCEGMAAMAAKHPNDQIANALSRVSRKIESLGVTKFAPKLTELDEKVISYYLLHRNGVAPK